MKLILLTLLVVINLVISAPQDRNPEELPQADSSGVTVDKTPNIEKVVQTIPTNLTLPEWKSPELELENQQLLKERKESEEILIDNVAYRGDAFKDYHIGLRQMNLFMRENYKKMMDVVGHNVYPLIVATDVDHDKRLSGTGSEYVLFLRNGTIRHMKPTPAQYEQNKNLAHLSMSIFTIISPYFHNPTSPMWHDQLKQLRTFVSNNLELINTLDASKARIRTDHIFCEDNLTVKDHRTMLTMVLNYIDSCFESNSVDVSGYKDFTARYLPYTEKALACASQIQAKASTIELTKWKRALGEVAWRNLYVIIPVMWPVSRVNPRQLIFEKLMDKDRIATHILKAEGAQSIEEARATSGRIIADRTMAHFVFGYDTPQRVDMNLALSTRRDLLATKTHGFLNPQTNRDNNTLQSFAAVYRPTVLDVDVEVEVDPNEIHFQESF